jgi:bifunctional enzyme CysN/CysC
MSGVTIWITGLSASGKTTIASEVARLLEAAGTTPFILDGDALRTGLNADLGFSRADRQENVRRVGEVALLLARSGQVVLVPLISPYRADRDRVRMRHVEHDVQFVEVYLDVPLAVCEGRDPKGLYARARAGQLQHFTGIDDPYEPPLHPELSITPGATADDDAARLLEFLANTFPR